MTKAEGPSAPEQPTDLQAALNLLQEERGRGQALAADLEAAKQRIVELQQREARHEQALRELAEEKNRGARLANELKVTQGQLADRDIQLRSDKLTGIPNLNELEERWRNMLEVVRRHRRAGDPRKIALIFADLDGLKQANSVLKEQGLGAHSTGDEYLKDAATRMSSTMREGDVLGRLSGDEFVALMYVKDEDEAVASVKRLMGAVHGMSDKWGQYGIEPGMTVGIDIMDGETRPFIDDFDLARASADAAQQFGKNNNMRNRYFIVDPSSPAVNS